MVDDGRRDRETLPACQSCTNPDFAVIGIGEEIFVKNPHPIEQAFPVHGSASRWKEDFLDPVVLAVIQLMLSPGPAQAVPVDKLSHPLNSVPSRIGTDFRGPH